MSFKLALICNLITSSFIYAGVICGITIGENLAINQWIYAIAAGMFLYIGVCDMIPELTEMREKIEEEDSESDKSFAFLFKLKLINIIIQNLGLLIGLGTMLVLALYADKINF